MKAFLVSIISVITVFNTLTTCPCAYAVKKSAGLEEGEIEKVKENISNLNKKVHTYTLFSPEDSAKLVEVKMALNSLADGKISDPSYAELFYNAAYILKEREYKQDAIQYFSVVIKNFPQTVYAYRAKNELKKFGIKFDEEPEE